MIKSVVKTSCKLLLSVLIFLVALNFAACKNQNKKAAVSVLNNKEGKPINVLVLVLEKYSGQGLDFSSYKNHWTVEKFCNADDERNLAEKAKDAWKSIGFVTNSSCANKNFALATTHCEPEENAFDLQSVCEQQFYLFPQFLSGLGDFEDLFDPSSDAYLNEVFKSRGKLVTTFEEASSVYKNENVEFVFGNEKKYSPVKKLFYIPETKEKQFDSLTEFSIDYMESVSDEYGFLCFMQYVPEDSVSDSDDCNSFMSAVKIAEEKQKNISSSVLVVAVTDAQSEQIGFYTQKIKLSTAGDFVSSVAGLF